MKEFWDSRYAGSEYAFGEKPNEFFRETVTGLPPGKLLMPAEGEGRNAVYAATLGWDVTAIDFSEEAKKKALRLADRMKVKIGYTVEDLLETDYQENYYDAAGLFFAHFPPRARKFFHHQVVRSLKPGGLVIMEAFSPKQLGNESGGPKSVEMLYDLEEVISDFRGHQVILSEELTRHLDEGIFHNGKADVIRLVVRKTG